MKTIQLRRYTLRPGARDDFLAWWRRVIPALREDAGFNIEFAFVDDQAGEFVWAVSVPGSQALFDELETEYLSSPSRARAFAGMPDWVSHVHAAFVDTAYPKQT